MPQLLCCSQVVKELAGAGSQFRVLALSATPGNDLKVGLCLWLAREAPRPMSVACKGGGSQTCVCGLQGGRLPDLCLWPARGKAPGPESMACKGGGSQTCVCGLQGGRLPDLCLWPAKGEPPHLQATDTGHIHMYVCVNCTGSGGALKRAVSHTLYMYFHCACVFRLYNRW